MLEQSLYAPVYLIARFMWRVGVEGRSHLQELGRSGAILVANHRCSLDPFFVQLAVDRRVHWLVAAEYFKHPLFGRLLHAYQAIPTNRSGSDTGATRRAVEYVARSKLVGLFPEGRLNRSHQPLQTIRAGAILVAGKANGAIVPIWISGAPISTSVWFPLFMPARVRITIGKPVAMSSEITQLTRREQGAWLSSLLLKTRDQRIGIEQLNF